MVQKGSLKGNEKKKKKKNTPNQTKKSKALLEQEYNIKGASILWPKCLISTQEKHWHFLLEVFLFYVIQLLNGRTHKNIAETFTQAYNSCTKILFRKPIKCISSPIFVI